VYVPVLHRIGVAESSDGCSPLCIAAARDNGALGRLLELYPDLDVNTPQSINHYTPLHR
jgi:hypothetical protein